MDLDIGCKDPIAIVLARVGLRILRVGELTRYLGGAPLHKRRERGEGPLAANLEGRPCVFAQARSRAAECNVVGAMSPNDIVPVHELIGGEIERQCGAGSNGGDSGEGDEIAIFALALWAEELERVYAGAGDGPRRCHAITHCGRASNAGRFQSSREADMSRIYDCRQNDPAVTMKLEERFRRVDHDTIEFTMTINDPQAYTKPWVSDKMTLTLADDKTRMREDVCVPSDEATYKDEIRNPAGGATKAR